jgi:hypothetical protein
MGQILLPKQYHPDFAQPGKKPIGLVEVDWANPLTKDLEIALLPAMWVGKNLADMGNSPVQPAINSGANTKGQFVAKTTADDDGFSLVNPSLGSQNRTVMLGHIKAAAVTNNALIASGTVASGQRWQLAYVSGSSLHIGVTSGGYQSSLTPVVGEFSISGIKFTGTTLADHTLFLNGVFENATGTRVINTTGASYVVMGEGLSQSTTGVTDKLFFYYHWNRALSDAEMLSIEQDPYQLFKPTTPQTYTFPAAAAGININATTDTLIISEQGAVVQADVDISIAAGTDTLVISEQGATVQADIDILISATTDTLIITENAATVQSDVDINVAANSDTLVISENAATVELITGISILATTGSLIISEQAAVVQADVDISITAGVDSLVISELQASITLDIGVTIDGSSSVIMTANFQSETLYFNGENYFTID